jgi:AhpD family alkylhydroperoxidase
MRRRIKNPALAVPGSLEALQALGKVARDAAESAGVPLATIELVNMRASQINGCAVCLDMHSRGLKKMGEADEKLFTVGGWRDAPPTSARQSAPPSS